MPCPNCKSTAKVTIGKKHYCSDCGQVVSTNASAAKQSMRSIRPMPTAAETTTAKPAPVASVATPAAAKPIVKVVGPVAPQRLMRDVGGPVARPKTVGIEDAAARPAEAFHARLKPARGGVLDLRAQKPKPVASTAIHASRTVASAHKPVAVAAAPVAAAETPKKRHTSISAKDMHSAAKTHLEPVAGPKPARQKQTARHLESAGVVQRSERIARFASAMPASKLAAAVKAETVAAPLELPRHTAAQHEHMTRLLDVMKTEKPGGHRQATTPSRASFAMAAVAIALVGSYIWMHNYPQLALTTAADKAGFSASLPSFVPSSYSLKGSPSYSPGLVTLNFASPSFSSPLKATQQPTAWDTSSLLDNYVAAKTASYTAVTGQGLTIYLMDGGKEATWINHGIWYSLDGVTNLSRDQLLKMAYSF